MQRGGCACPIKCENKKKDGYIAILKCNKFKFDNVPYTRGDAWHAAVSIEIHPPSKYHRPHNMHRSQQFGILFNENNQLLAQNWSKFFRYAIIL